MDKPTEEERLNFVRSYGVEPVDVNTDLTMGEAATFVAETTPIIGDAMAAKEVYDELMKEEPNYPLIAALGGTAIVGAIPGIGDAAAAGLRKVAETYKRLEVDPDAVGMMGGNVRLKPKEKNVWSYPKQLYDSAATSINEFKRPAGYNKLKKRGEIKDGDVIVDIGGGRFDNLVEDAAEEGATVKVYDPFNRTPEHNATVVDSVKDGQADMAMSHNVLNVIKEDENILSVVEQAENAVKPGGKAHFSVYEGSKADREKGARQTSKGWQRFQTTSEYLPFVEKVFGKDNVTLKDSIITATKNVKGFREGGMAIEEQMSMNFGDVPDNTVGVDPVSGNEIPMGSTAENVRDDIPTMLSEGEIVVPADVVNYWGVKLFEDLRAQAKMGYAQMEEDGRIGGEPIEDDEDTMGLEMSDLEVMEMPDDMPEVEEAFLGKFFAGLRAANKKAAQQSVRDRFKKAEQRKSVDKIKAGANKKPKFKNKAEEFLFNLRNPNRNESSNRRVTLTEKPPTSDDDRSSGTIAEKINFGGDYDKPEKKKAKPKKKPVFKPTPFVDDVPEKEGVNLRSTEGFGTKFMRGLGVQGYNEGVFQQKGGFDMTEAKPINSAGAVEVTEGMTMEARIYVNDAGHEITIMFANGVPITPIPAGYYPKEETVTPETGVQTGGGGGGFEAPEPPEPINYKELSIDELTKEVKDLQTPPPIPGILGALFKGAQERHKAKTMEEIDRRLKAEDLAIYEKEYLQNLKEVLEAPQGRGVVGKFIDKLTGQVVEEPNVPTLDGPKYDFMPDSYSVTEPYTPEAQTPNVSEQGVDASDFDQMQDRFEIERIEQEMKSKPRPKDYDTSSTDVTPPEQINVDPTRQQTDSQRRRDRQQANKNITGRSARKKQRQAQSATRGLTDKEKKGGGGLDSRFGITGLEKGGLASKKKKSK